MLSGPVPVPQQENSPLLAHSLYPLGQVLTEVPNLNSNLPTVPYHSPIPAQMDHVGRLDGIKM